MPPNLYPSARPQSIGEVLDTAFRIFQASVVACLPYGILLMLTGQLPNVYDLLQGRPLRGFAADDPVWWLLYLLGTLATLALWSAVILRQRAIAGGAPTSTRAELSTVLRRLPAIAVLVILSAIGVGVGAMLLILPGVYLAVAFMAAWPALLLQERNPLQALLYSVRLVTGNWWRTLITFVIAAAILLVFYVLAAAIAAFVIPLTGADDVALVTSAIMAVVIVALGAVGAPFMCAVLLAVYANLQVRREGADLERRIAGAVRD